MREWVRYRYRYPFACAKIPRIPPASDYVGVKPTKLRTPSRVLEEPWTPFALQMAHSCMAALMFLSIMFEGNFNIFFAVSRLFSLITSWYRTHVFYLSYSISSIDIKILGCSLSSLEKPFRSRFPAGVVSHHQPNLLLLGL